MSVLMDERIVEMKFDNNNFEKNVKTSMSTIEDLKSSLNFSGISSSMNNTFNSLDFSGIISGLTKVKDNFSTMEIAAISVISNITNRLVDMAAKSVKALSVDNITSGWTKYAEKTTAVATLFSQGYDMDVINKQLDKLLWFTDETSYGFTGMVSNIGKFTASGQGLEDAVGAMMGIANWAALSGQNASTASRAMDQLSQSLGRGSVKLMDWQSIQTANMDTKEFRENVLSSAVAMGELTKSIDGRYITKSGNMFDTNQFTEFLSSDAWLTTDVLMKTLKTYSSAVDDIYDITLNDATIDTTSQAIEKYSDTLDSFGIKAFKAAQEAKTFREAIDATKEAVASQWTSIFEKIFGQYDTAKDLWTNLANELWDVFAGPLSLTNEIVDAWKGLGGSDDLFANTEEQTGAFWNMFYAILEIKNLIKNAWRTIFPISEMVEESELIDTIANKVKKFTEKIREITENIKMSEKTADTFTNILKGLFSIIKVITSSIKALFAGIAPLFSVVNKSSKLVFNILGSIGDRFATFVNATTIFTSVGTKMADILNMIINEIKDFNIINNVIKLIMGLKNAFNQNGGTTENFSKILTTLKNAVGILLIVFKTLYNFIKTYILPAFWSLLGVVFKIVGAIGGKIVSAFSWIGGLIIKFVEFIKTSEIVNKTFSVITSGFKNLASAINNFFGFLGDANMSSVDTFSNNIENKLNPLESVLKGITGLFTGLWSILKSLLPLLSSAISFVGNLLTSFGETVSNFFGGNGNNILSKILSFGFLVTATKTITDFIYMLKSITFAITDAIGSFSEMMYSKALINYAEALKELGIAILIIVAALLLISMIDDAALARSLSTLVIIMSTMMIMLKILKNISEKTGILGIKTMIMTYAMINFAIAIGILALAIKIMSSISQEELLNGLTGLIMIMSVLLIAAKIISSNSKTFIMGTSGLISMALAVLLLSVSLKSIGKMDPNEFKQGIKGIVILTSLCVLFAKISGTIKKAIISAAGMILFSEALILASVAMIIIGSMGWKKLAIGITGITAIVGLMLILGAIGSHVSKAIISAFAMLIVSSALMSLAFSLALFAIVSWVGIGKAMTSLIGIFIAFKFIGNIVNSHTISTVFSMLIISSTLMLLAFSLAAFAIVPWSGILKAVVSLVSIFTLLSIITKFMGIQTIAYMSLLGFALIPLSAGLMLLAMAMLSLGVVPFKLIGKALLILVVSLGLLAIAGMVLKPFTKTILLVAISLLMFATALFLINAAMSIIIITLGIFGKAAVESFMLFLEAIVQTAPLMISAIATLAASIFQGLAIASTGLFELLNALVGQILEFLWRQGPLIIITVVMLLASLLVALAEYFPTMAEALISMVITLLEVIRDNASTIINIILDILIKLIEALTAKMPEIIDKLGEMVITIIESLVETIVELVPRLVNSGFDLILGLIRGLGQAIEDRAEDVKKTMAGFCQNIINAVLIFFGMKKITGEASSFKEVGRNLVQGLINGMIENAKNVGEKVKQIGKSIIEGFKTVLGINSPSTETWEDSKYLMEGFSGGMDANAKKVTNSVKRLGKEVLDEFDNSGMFGVIENLYDALNGDIDGELVIKPIMDLTEIQNGTDSIYGMLNKVNGYSLSGSNELANQTSYDIRNNKNEVIKDRPTSNKTKTDDTTPIVFNNTYNINGAVDPKKVAEEVSHIQQIQVNRRKVQYGQSGI